MTFSQYAIWPFRQRLQWRAVRRSENNMVTGHHGNNGVAHLLNHTGSFVSKDGGKRSRVDPAADEHVRVTDPCCNHPDPSFIGPAGVQLKPFIRERCVVLSRDSGSYLH